MDSSPIKAELEKASADKSEAEINYAEFSRGYRVEDVAQANAQLKQSEANLNNAKMKLERANKLYATGAISRQDFDNAKDSLDGVQAAYNAALENSKKLQAGFRREDVDKARADFQSSQAVLEQVNIRYHDTSLFSPSNGVILARVNEVGAIVKAGQTVFTLSLEKPVWVRTNIDETKLGKIFPGQEVLVYIDSLPGKPFKGKVGYISPRAEFTPKNVETTELRTELIYRLRINVDESSLDIKALRQGMPVTIKINSNNGNSHSENK